MNKANTIDQYIKGFSAGVASKLEEIRGLIRQEAPDASEKISYGMPTFFLNKNLVHFAGFKNHIGFYPVPTAMEEFKKELAGFKTGKGSVQFPLDKPLPRELIKKIVKFRVRENSRNTK